MRQVAIGRFVSEPQARDAIASEARQLGRAAGEALKNGALRRRRPQKAE